MQPKRRKMLIHTGLTVKGSVCVTKTPFLRSDDRGDKERYWNLPMKVKDY